MPGVTGWGRGRSEWPTKRSRIPKKMVMTEFVSGPLTHLPNPRIHTFLIWYWISHPLLVFGVLQWSWSTMSCFLYFKAGSFGDLPYPGCCGLPKPRSALKVQAMPSSGLGIQIEGEVVTVLWAEGWAVEQRLWGLAGGKHVGFEGWEETDQWVGSANSLPFLFFLVSTIESK